MSAYEQLMRDLEGEAEEVVLATFDAYQEMVEDRKQERDWLAEGAAQAAIAEIMQR